MTKISNFWQMYNFGKKEKKIKNDTNAFVPSVSNKVVKTADVFAYFFFCFTFLTFLIFLLLYFLLFFFFNQKLILLLFKELFHFKIFYKYSFCYSTLFFTHSIHKNLQHSNIISFKRKSSCAYNIHHHFLLIFMEIIAGHNIVHIFNVYHILFLYYGKQ